MTPALTVHGVSKSFGGLKAVHNICFDVHKANITAVIGPNGAGKTTLFNILTGIYRCDEGEILLGREAIHALPVHEISRMGVARTFQNIRLFDSMSVLDNVLVARFARQGASWLECLVHNKRHASQEKEAQQKARQALEFVGMESMTELRAGELSYGYRRRLEIARALATEPKVMLLDEPGAGMNPSELMDLVKSIRLIKEQGIAVVLIEHHMSVVMELADDVLVLDHGEEIARGKPSEITVNPQVISAYLGEALSHA